MPEEYASKELASAAGAAKGIADWIKQQNELKLAQAKASSTAGNQMLRTILPLLFRQRQFEQEQTGEWQRLMYGEAGKERRAGEEMAWEKEKFATTTRLESIRDEIAQMRWSVERGDTIEENRWQRAMDELRIKEQELKRVTDEALALRQLALEQERFGLEEKKFAALGVQFEKTFGLAEKKEAREAEEPATAEINRQVSTWRSDVFDLYNSYVWISFTQDPNNDKLATAAKNAIATLEARRMAIPEKQRPPASELPEIQESGKRRWFILPDSFRREVVPRQEPAAAAPDATLQSAMQKANWTQEVLNAIKAYDDDRKAKFWSTAYQALKKAGLSEQEIAEIEKAVGIQ